MLIEITYEMLQDARTKKGGYTNKQVQLARHMTDSNRPIATLQGLSVPVNLWNQFCEARSKTHPKKESEIFTVHAQWLVEYTSKDLVNQYHQSVIVGQANNEHWQLYAIGKKLNQAKKQKFESLK